MRLMKGASLNGLSFQKGGSNKGSVGWRFGGRLISGSPPDCEAELDEYGWVSLGGDGEGCDGEG